MSNKGELKRKRDFALSAVVSVLVNVVLIPQISLGLVLMLVGMSARLSNFRPVPFLSSILFFVEFTISEKQLYPDFPSYAGMGIENMECSEEVYWLASITGHYWVQPPSLYFRGLRGSCHQQLGIAL